MTTAALDISEFAAFFEAVHKVPPFPWQERLAKEVVATGRWPDALDLPTGSGKTAALDIAVFQLALDVTSGVDRRAPVRLAFVVDRRLVVDDAYERGNRLARALADEKEVDVVRRVASRLSLLAESSARPLHVVRLRGGMPKEPDWVRTPTQPTIVVSTVDQVGSRVFFRGYGVSDQMKPIHAGLLGVDTLFLLDEAHLSQPFVETLRAAKAMRGQSSDSSIKGRSHVVTLSATPLAAGTFHLDGADRADERLQKRLAASKPAALEKIAGSADSGAYVKAIAARAFEMSRDGGGAAAVVGVVVNRVRRARQVFETLSLRVKQGSSDATVGPDAASRVILLTGRCRDLDRADLLNSALPAMRATRGFHSSVQRLFVVATQCVEAGADLDFDALVTELAPLDSLRQRFGRLNRMGRYPSAPAAIVASADQLRARASDPVYGDSLRETWTLLEASATKVKGERLTIDMGIDGTAAWMPPAAKLAPYLAPRKQAPVLLPTYFDAWTQTSPVPENEAEIALFLHGPDSGPADVEIVWRADLDEGNAAEWEERVVVCPPSALEALSIPVWEARAWLQNAATADIVDLEGAGPTGDESYVVERSALALRWNGFGRRNELITATNLQPGDRIIVPASRKGCDEWGWNPASTKPVSDRGTESNSKQRGLDILRLSSELEFPDGSIQDIERLRERLREQVDELSGHPDRSIATILNESGAYPARWRDWAREGGALIVVRSERSEHEGLVLALQRRAKARADDDATTEDDDSVKAPRGRSILLSAHSKGVGDWAAELARKAGLHDAMVADLGLAGFLHDAGKAHPQFRSWLYGGDPLLGESAPPLAKSGRKLDRGARSRSGLPEGARHEAASLRYALAHPSFAQAHDPELVLWLIGTHHGYGRPFFPPVAWPPRGDVFSADLGDGSGNVSSRPEPEVQDIGSGWIESFQRLKDRYGPWGVAWLEAVLRLADHRRSEAEQKGA